MRRCDVCGSSEFHEAKINQVFHIDEKPILVEAIPAVVCNQCGEMTFSAETAEQLRLMLNPPKVAPRSIEVDVYAFPA